MVWPFTRKNVKPADPDYHQKMFSRKGVNFPRSPKVNTSLSELEYLKAELRRKRKSCTEGIEALEEKIVKELAKVNAQKTQNDMKKTLNNLRLSHLRNTASGQKVARKELEEQLYEDKHRQIINAEMKKLEENIEKEGATNETRKAAENLIKKDAHERAEKYAKEEVEKILQKPEEYSKSVKGKYTLKAQRLWSKLPNLTYKSKSSIYEEGSEAAKPLAKLLAEKNLTVEKLESANVKKHVSKLREVLSTRPAVYKRSLTNTQKKALQDILDEYYKVIRETKILEHS